MAAKKRLTAKTVALPAKSGARGRTAGAARIPAFIHTSPFSANPTAHSANA